MAKSIAIILATGLLAATCAAQQHQLLYDASKKGSDQGVSVRSWGGGGISETEELAPADPRTLRVGTRNFYQGGIVRFTKAPNLAVAFADKDNLLRVTLKVPRTVANRPDRRNGNPAAGGNNGGRPGGGRPGGGPGGPGTGGRPGGGPTPGQMPPGIPPSAGIPPSGIPGLPPGAYGMPPNGAQGGPAGVMAPAANSSQPTVPTSLRMIVTTSDGKKSETYLDISPTYTSNDAWFDLAVPLQALSGFDRTNKEIVSIALSADTPSTFFVKKIDITDDTSPIYATIEGGDDVNLAFGDEYTFVGQGEGGSTGLKYEWNFDADNGKGTDAEGRTVKRKFRKAGVFTVRLTVTDIYGLKKPYTTSMKVTVNP